MAWFDVLYGSDGRVPFQHRSQRLGANIGDAVATKAGKGRIRNRRRKKEREGERRRREKKAKETTRTRISVK